MFVDEGNRTPLEMTNEELQARKAAMLDASEKPDEYDRMERREQVLLQRQISAQQAARARARTGRRVLPMKQPVRRSLAMRRS